MKAMDAAEHDQGTETHLTSTDTIIEELKALAKSMLESTEAFRRKARNGDSCKAYDSLLSTLETSTQTPKGIKETIRHRHQDPADGNYWRENQLEKKVFPLEGGGIFVPGNHQADKNKDIITDEETNKNGIKNDDATTVTDSEPNDVENHFPTHVQTKEPVLRPSAGDCSGDFDDNVFDGVKTHVIFKAVDPLLYEEVSRCTWHPERLRLNLDTGVAIENINDDDDDEDTTEDESESDKKGDTKKVFRVPSFPFGGGVTEEQTHLLSSMFSDTMRRGFFLGSRKPMHITKKQFLAYEYDECLTSLKDQRNFKPTSPFEFVVELDHEIVFDAVRAREERRQDFRRLAKEGKAPMTMGSFNLRVIMDPLKTGFEEEKSFPIERGTIVADRYQIIELLGKATFSRAVRCYDLHQPIFAEDETEDNSVSNDSSNTSMEKNEKSGEKRNKVIGYAECCLKIINNSKDFFDQSLDEIRLLTLINKYKDPDKAHVVRLFDCFYYKEHTMLVTELLSDNLYEYAKYNREKEDTFYFTLPRLRSIARQIVGALAYVHSLNLIHADLKPENILFVSHRRCQIKVIDFGSSCFLSDHLTSYIQSRSYRAPEVILGCDYDGRIDVWSLGAILVELVTGEVLFISETVPEMLARIVYVCGQPLPRRMLWEGRHSSKFINKFGCIFEQGNKDGEDATEDSAYYYLYTPVFPIDTGAKKMDSGSVKKIDEEEGSNDNNNNKNDDGNKTVTSERGEGNQRISGSTSFSDKPYNVLRQKLAAHNVKDELFLSFVEQCLTLDHKKRPKSKDLLSHPFLTEADELTGDVTRN